MQVTGQNNVQPKTAMQSSGSPVSTPVVPQPQVCQPCSSTSVGQIANNNVAQSGVTNPVQAQYPQGYIPPQYSIYPQYQPVQNQNCQVPASTSGVNIQIFNPSVGTPGAQAPTYNVNAPCYPAGYYTGNYGQQQVPQQTIPQQNTVPNAGGETAKDTKTEKRKIVELTDDYIKNLESHLNSQEKAVRINAAKEVFARLEEDDSRNDDKALTALVNKMLQDPCEEVRILALSALDGRICKGDDYTVNVLKGMQQGNNGYGQDAIDASSILLKMSGRQVEKEFEVKNNKDDKSKGSETNKSSVKENKKA